MGKLNNKVCIITGCASGLGKQQAIRFAVEGAKLSICDVQEARLMETKQICEEKGAEVLAMAFDLSVADDIEKFVNATVEKYGPSIDVLVNNAHHTTMLIPFLDKSEDEIEMEWESGPLAMWRLMKLCHPYMKGHPGAGASIINFSSKAGMEGTAGHAVYAMVKEAIRGLSRVVAREFGPDNIRVNTVMPNGFTDNVEIGLQYQTEDIQEWARKAFKDNPFGRPGDPYKDVAPIVVFLASDDSHWITGDNIHADGGSFIHA